MRPRIGEFPRTVGQTMKSNMEWALALIVDRCWWIWGPLLGRKINQKEIQQDIELWINVYNDFGAILDPLWTPSRGRVGLPNRSENSPKTIQARARAARHPKAPQTPKWPSPHTNFIDVWLICRLLLIEVCLFPLREWPNNIICFHCLPKRGSGFADLRRFVYMATHINRQPNKRIHGKQFKKKQKKTLSLYIYIYTYIHTWINPLILDFSKSKAIATPSPSKSAESDTVCLRPRREKLMSTDTITCTFCANGSNGTEVSVANSWGNCSTDWIFSFNNSNSKFLIRRTLAVGELDHDSLLVLRTLTL